MAARRCRIKAVANLPIRRDRGGGTDEHSLHKDIKEKSNEQNKTVEGNPTTSKDETSKENNSNIVSLKVNSPKNVIFNHPSNEPTINVNNALTRPTSEELSQSNISVVISPQTNGNDHEKQQDFETSTSKVKAIVSETKSTEQDSVSSKLPIKFVGRKRVKPAVSISNISRKAKEIIVVTDEVLPEPNAFRLNHETSSTSSSCHLTAMEESPITDKSKYNISLSQVDVTLPLDKDIGVGMPTIIQTIPTGTAIRPNESNCPSYEFSAPGLLHTNGEAPQTLPEADLPSEGAGGSTGGLAMDPPCLPNIVPCPSNTPHRSKFARPTPRIPDKTSRRRGHSSASESDDDSKRPFINSGTSTIRSKFARPSPKVGDATSRRTGNHGSASESDDESRRPSLSKSPALTSVLPMSSRIITKTMNGTAKQGSASESEDDVIIVEPDPVKEPSCMEKQQDKNSGIGSKELVGESEERDENIRSVWSKRTINHIRRKRHNAITSRIAQGKKELDTKLNGSKPARSSLTMFDLIYYNPTTNPMKKVAPSESVDHTKSINEGENRLVEERLAEEAVDDVTNSTSNVEEETALPVPQVKVGPDGQLILDEMSLVIETTGAKKSREELENSSIVVDLGIGSTSYSAYSKKTYKKGKEWSAHDTLKFYRALNTLGTDFLLMQSIFPKMTRRDLKMKFKREERVNAALIDKALRYPLNFDMSELQKEAQREAEMEIEQEERRKEEAKQKKLAKLEYRKLHKRKPGQSYATSFIFEKQDTGEFHNKRLRKKVCKSKIENKSKKKKRNNALEKGFCGIASDSDSENSSYNEEYESDGNKNDVGSKTCEEVVLNKKPRATKSGRISRPKVMHDHVHDFIELDGESSNDNSIVPMSPVNESFQETTGDINAETLEQISKSAPGSLLIFRAPSPTNPDHQVVHVFMLGGPLPENTPALTDSGGDLTSKDIENSVLELNPLANQSNTTETETCNKNSEETPFSLIFPK
ncbi:unnamed protein product [Timema podura]|uniref:Transcription factor TFIIIB component B'' Myb domain-containing protein n=1 Tax=Timema podura TaxID=61482 RepID=A0ABN7NQL7_TIMPD|nr:unnamed protein product [Timema podura]